VSLPTGTVAWKLKVANALPSVPRLMAMFEAAASSASEKVMLASPLQKEKAPSKTIFSRFDQFDAASNEYLTVPPAVPGVALPHLMASETSL
jgi:hypothetical protein